MLFRTFVSLVGLTINIATMPAAFADQPVATPAAVQATEPAQPAIAPAAETSTAPVGFGWG